MPIRYAAGESVGVTLAGIESRTVEVTLEEVNPAEAAEGEAVVYTATVKDSTGAALPTNFVADLMMDGTVTLASAIAFDAAHYDPPTFALTINFNAPAMTPGDHSVTLKWAKQTL